MKKIIFLCLLALTTIVANAQESPTLTVHTDTMFVSDAQKELRGYILEIRSDRFDLEIYKNKVQILKNGSLYEVITFMDKGVTFNQDGESMTQFKATDWNGSACKFTVMRLKDRNKLSILLEYPKRVFTFTVRE